MMSRPKSNAAFAFPWSYSVRAEVSTEGSKKVWTMDVMAVIKNLKNNFQGSQSFPNTE